MKTAIAFLCILVAGLAYFRITDTKDIQQEIRNNPHLCPNSTQAPRPTNPVPHGPGAVGIEEATLFAAAIKACDKNMTINNKPVVRTNKQWFE